MRYKLMLVIYGVLVGGSYGFLNGCGKEIPPPLIPTSVFFMNPDCSNYTISPDGEHVAFLAQWEYRMNIHVQRVGESDVRRLTASNHRDIPYFGWATSNRLVYVQDSAGDENFHLFAVNIDGGEPEDLTPFDNIRIQFVSTLRLVPDVMVISMNRRDPRLMDCYRIDINSGELEMAAENPGHVMIWVSDHHGQVRAAMALAENQSQLLYRETEDQPFQTVATSQIVDLLVPLSFSFDGQQLYVLSNKGQGTEGLYTFDPAKRDFVNLLYQHPDVDISFIFLSYHRRLLRGVAYIDDRLRFHFFDSEGERIQRELESRLPGYGVWVSSLCQDESRMVLQTLSDKSRGAYFLFDQPRGELSKLADISPWIEESHLCDMKAIQFTARDGLRIPGYLILPKGLKPRDLPVIIQPCSFPWSRETWGYDPTAQFLANRGYAVLQVNYRGTMGYGSDYLKAGFGEWGGAILNDIEDGVRWLIAEGIADPARIGILGHSVGGYIALASGIAKPNLYACVADYSGPTSLVTFVTSPPPYWYTSMELLYDLVGDPKEDREWLEAQSPLYHPETFDLPLLVAQGINDPLTPVAETDSFVADLRSLGKEVTYLRLEEEGHRFVRAESRFALFRAFEEFFGEHLEGRVE